MAYTPATISILESNGVGPASTTTCTNLNYGSNDSANIVRATYPIDAGSNSFIKYWQLQITAAGDSASVTDISVWRSGADADVLGDPDDDHVWDATLPTYTTPATTSLGVTPFPTAEPLGSAANVQGTAITITSGLPKYAPDSTHYVVSQIKTDAGDTAGVDTTLYINWVWFEVAV